MTQLTSPSAWLRIAMAWSFLMSAIYVTAQPVPLATDLSITKVLNTGPGPVRIDADPLTNQVYYMNENGSIYHVDLSSQPASLSLMFNSDDHGLNQTYGLEIGATGTFYVVAAESNGGNNIGKIAKGVPDGNGGYTWSLMAQTEPYRESGNRDHKFNAVIESTDGQFVYVNSGSRTDHAEAARNDGLREMPITSAILKVPVSADNLLLPNNQASLESNGYLYADGIRNTFDLEYGPNGDLFGVENSDTRDNEEELNWLEEGKHYGFPWKIGTHHNPQQFATFNPPGSDNLLVQGINMESTFYNDPTFPAPPAGVSFTDPILNLGPHADIIRDSVDGVIKDANAIGRPMGTFTPHSSPVALTFDVAEQLGGDYTGTGFAMSYNARSRSKYTPFLDPGEDLLWLQLTKGAETYTTTVTRIAEGFEGPIDAVLVGNKLYVAEYSGAAIWEVTFPASTVGITQPTLGADLISVYPNPMQTSLSLQPSRAGLTILQAELYHLDGRRAGVWLSQDQPQRQHLDTRALAPGVYLLRVETSQGLMMQKVIKGN